MTIESAIIAMAGFMVLLSVALTQFIDPAWMWLTVFIGANLLQSAITGFCPAVFIFKSMGLKSAAEKAQS